METEYKRILLKLSGEALAGERGTGLDFGIIESVCKAVGECQSLGVEVGIVIGGGNFWRGAKDGGGKMERSRADRMGMLATMMNSLAVLDVFEQLGIGAVVQSSAEMPAFAELFTRDSAVRHLKDGKAVIFACGTGCPYFSTDTGAVLKAAEIGADAVLMAKNIDGVYSADPKKDPTAVKLDRVTYEYIIAHRMGVIDLTAAALAMDNGIPTVIFALKEPDNIRRAALGEGIGTVVAPQA